jgi:hypothetical protein
MTDARTSQVGLPGADPGDGLDAFSHQGTPKLGADTLPVDASEDPILSEQEPLGDLEVEQDDHADLAPGSSLADQG